MRILKLFTVVSLVLGITGFAWAECAYFTAVRNKPQERKSFLAHFEYAKSLPLMLYGDFKRKSDHLYKPYQFNNQTFMLDRMTIGCLGCHNSKLLVDNDRSGNTVLEKGFHSFVGKHAIGIDYHEMVLANPNSFKKPDPKRNNIVFVGGKLGCVSCHYPFSTLPFYLNALEKDQALCKECHVR